MRSSLLGRAMRNLGELVRRLCVTLPSTPHYADWLPFSAATHHAGHQRVPRRPKPKVLVRRQPTCYWTLHDERNWGS